MRDSHPRRERHEEDRLSAFLDDELPEDDALDVTRHLASCDRCMDELEDVRLTREALRGLPNLDPPEALFSDAVAAASLDRVRWRRTVRLTAASLAGTALIATAAFAAGGEGDGTVVPPVEMFVVDHVVRVGGGPVITPVDLGSPGR